ncbi:hypothetical protein F8388_008467 [Cannabis sativa]|uniref:Uncharacterized protein n=1 Tax=Cannabis sativa TaxID=3483 RepID=A0A7J6EJU3_CANSA|nr:hypothetical protein F8388_008467 [Cannabis sativa]
MAFHLNYFMILTSTVVGCFLYRPIKSFESFDCIRAILGMGLRECRLCIRRECGLRGSLSLSLLVEHARKLWPHKSTIIINAITFGTNVIEKCKDKMNKVTENIMGLMFGPLGLTPEDTNILSPKLGGVMAHFS